MNAPPAVHRHRFTSASQGHFLSLHHRPLASTGGVGVYHPCGSSFRCVAAAFVTHSGAALFRRLPGAVLAPPRHHFLRARLSVQPACSEGCPPAACHLVTRVADVRCHASRRYSTTAPRTGRSHTLTSSSSHAPLCTDGLALLANHRPPLNDPNHQAATSGCRARTHAAPRDLLRYP